MARANRPETNRTAQIDTHSPAVARHRKPCNRSAPNRTATVRERAAAVSQTTYLLLASIPNQRLRSTRGAKFDSRLRLTCTRRLTVGTHRHNRLREHKIHRKRRTCTRSGTSLRGRRRGCRTRRRNRSQSHRPRAIGINSIASRILQVSKRRLRRRRGRHIPITVKLDQCEKEERGYLRRT
jgi:hypothetical protein